MRCPLEDGEASRMCPVLKAVSCVVIEIFTRNVRAKQSGHGEPRIGCPWAECGIFLKPSSRHANSFCTLYIREKTTSTHDLLKSSI